MDSLTFIDTLTPYYKGVLEAMTILQRKIMIQVLLSYKKGISVKEIATKTFENVNKISSILNRLRLYNFVTHEDKRWYVPDEDFLRITAWRWDNDFRKFLKTYKGDDASIIDTFISTKGE